MKNLLSLLLFPLALSAQKYQVYPGEYDNWVRHPTTRMLYNVVANSNDPVPGIPAVADGEGKGSAALHTAGFIGVDGFAYVWGDNTCNISGLGLKLPTLEMTKTAVGNARQIVAYANSGEGSGPGLGYGFAIVTNDNKLVLLGNTQSGFRGDGTEGNKAEQRPYRVTAVSKPILKVVAGSFIYVLYTDGTVDSWGGTRRPYYPTFTLGRGVDNPDPTRPGAMKFPEPIVDLAGGGDWTLFKGKSGALYGVAYGTRYLGVGPNVPGRNIPFNLTKVLGLPGNPVQLAVGAQASYVLMANGDAYAWGDNTQGAIGNGKEAKFANFAAPWNGGILWVDKPVKINPAGVSFVRLFASIGDAFYAVAEDRNGHLWVWGRNKGYVLWNSQGSPDPTIQANQPNRWDVVAPMKIDGFEPKVGGAVAAKAGGTASTKTEGAASAKTGAPPVPVAIGGSKRTTVPRQDGMVDTLVDVGGNKLHFVVRQGVGFPIVFAGGGEDVPVWNKMIRPVGLRTAATIIVFDGAEAGGLETGLSKLGYGGKIVLVARSGGRTFAEGYASRHPEDVKATVVVEDDIAEAINAVVRAYNDASRGQ